MIEDSPWPYVENNRRAEGATRLSLRLGDGEMGAVALVCCSTVGDYGLCFVGTQA